MTAPGCCGRWTVDDEEVDSLLRELGLELPPVANDVPGDGVGPLLTDLDELGDLE